MTEQEKNEGQNLPENQPTQPNEGNDQQASENVEAGEASAQKKVDVEDQEPVEETSIPEETAAEAKTEEPESSSEDEKQEKDEAEVGGTVDQGSAEESPKPEETKVEAKAEKTETSPEAEKHEDDEAAVGDAVESDEHHDEDEYHKDEDLEMPDYDHMPNEKLVAEAEKLIKQNPVQKIKDHIDLIKAVLYKNLEETRQEKLHEFLEQGGNEIDFQYVQPLRDKFKKLYQTYRDERSKYYQELEKQLKENLAIKEDIVKQIKELPLKEGPVQDVYKIFRDLQDRWRNTGPVPRTESANLWQNYHHHVDNFYEYLKLSNELRELDFKKNQEEKTHLCEEAEALANRTIDKNTFTELQKLHKKWKEIGPVEKEMREELWQRFSEATRKIHENRHEYYKIKRAERETLLAEKKELIEQIKNFPIDKLNRHIDWQKAIQEVNKIRDRFKSIGRLAHEENDAVWDAYREANRNFNRAKNQFYKELKSRHAENVKKKRELVERAKELQDSTDYSETAKELKKIQADWKKIGYIPKPDSDILWNEFRGACNHFFERLHNRNKEKDEALSGNLEAKKALFAEVENYDPTSDEGKPVESLKGFISRWKEIGSVPRNESKIENEFNKLIDEKFNKIDIARSENALIRFENKVELWLESGDEDRLEKERDIIRKKIDEIKRDLIQLETNIQFFNVSDGKNPLFREAQKNVERHQTQLEQLKQKLTTLRTLKKKAEEDE